MAVTQRITQAYRQAPWRTQLQWSGFFLLALICGVLVAGLYLSISAQAATAGLEIQDLEVQKEEIHRQLADLKSQIAQLTSETEMAKRAKELGFKKIESTDPVYITIPGYTGRDRAILAPPPGPDMLVQPLLKPAYTQSLWEWFFQGALAFEQSTGGQIP